MTNSANVAAPIPPNVDAIIIPIEEHPAHAHDAIPTDDPESNERLNFLEFMNVYIFILITMLIKAAVTLDKTNENTFSSGR